MFENVMRKLNKILDSKIKIREAIKKINFSLTDDVPLKDYHNYIIEQKQKEEQYKEAVEFYRIRTDNGKNFENFFDPMEMNDYVLEFKEYLETTYNITEF
jgi:uncharacterized short protein YbdD (DUF466 family)